MSVSPGALAATHAAAFTDHRSWSADEFRALIDTPHVMLLGDAEAFVLARVVAGEAEILTLATHPAHQRQGHARRLLAALEQRISGHAEVIFLEVDAENAPARALYQSAGYNQTGNRKGYYQHPGRGPSDALILSKTLA